MFGLSADEWRDLLLSVNVHRKSRRLTPYQVAELLDRALKEADIESLSRELGFEEPSTLRRIHRIFSLPAELAPVVDWGVRKGTLSMSVASELLRLPSEELVREAVRGAIENGLSKEEARQVIQIRERSGASISECIAGAVRTRPRRERHELIVGSLLGPEARRASATLGNEETARRLKLLLAARFPDVVMMALRVSGERFSVLLAEMEASKLREALGAASVESVVTEMAQGLDTR